MTSSASSSGNGSSKRKERSNIQLILSTLPTKPGVYRHLDENGKVLYVGKAKNLKRRVSSYFNKTQDSPKVRMLVSKIRDIQVTVVDTEWEALLLENTLIKEYKPRYNIMLKDDKTYPWIAVTKEEFPRVFPTRSPDHRRQETFGPYASVKYMNTLLDTAFAIFPLRRCKILRQNDRPCLQYQLKKCPAPCAGKITAEEYQENVRRVIEILKGNSGLIIKQLQSEMMACAERWEFEKAQEIKQKIEVLTQFRGKSVVVNPELTQLDVFSMVEDEQSAYVNFMRVMEGAVVQSYTIEITRKADTSKEELLLLGMADMRSRFGELCPNVLVPFLPEMEAEGHTFAVPQRGDKKKLLDLSLKNAFNFMTEKNRRRDLVSPERRGQRVLSQLQKELELEKLPNVIECFDNSNFQGDYAVAAMVQFVNAKPNKSAYRHFNIKTVEGPDDYASMKEVVRRRYARLLEEDKPLPDLIITDGGQGQMEVVRQVVQDELKADIPIAGLAKDDRHRTNELLYGFPPKKVGIKINSELFRLLTHIQDEVHRFAITHHRKKFTKGFVHSELDDIRGIGKATKEKLLKHFKSVKRITAATEEELAAVIGPAKAKVVAAALTKKTSE
ncbi:MAG: excinuclease ABC subunit C [Bacteroidales bacterium]|nr:excinuclease ABC subunit C [Bacteroidales bacterium]